MGRILGIDPGERRLGLALSDPLHLIASPYKTLEVTDPEQTLQELAAIIKSQEVDLLVVGLPLGMRGQETRQTTRAREFARTLQRLGYKVILEDERLTSVSAKRSLVKQKKKTGHNKAWVDQTAAALILQQYLDKHSR
jgi:putative Holliday junction resolvase